MRRVLAVIGALVLIAALPGAAAARQPIREIDHSWNAGCFGLETPLGIADFNGYVSDLYGPDAWIDIFEGEPYASDLVLTRDWEAQPTVEFEGLSVHLEIPVVEFPAATPGVVTVDGTLSPVDTLAFDDRFRNGNSTERFQAEGTVFAFEGTLVLPGGAAVDLDPAVCDGSEVDSTWFVSQPNARVNSFSTTSGECQLVNEDGDTGFLFGSANDGILFVDGYVLDGGGAEVAFFGEGAVGPDGTTVLVLQEYDPQTGVGIGTGTATITATDTGEAFEYALKDGAGFDRVRGTLVDIDGSLETSVGAFSLDHCIAANQDVKRVATSSQGPKPGGKRPANDLPSGAISVKPGSRYTVSTKGAQVPREADYECLAFQDGPDGEIFEIPVEHTVWYKVSGTGAEVTIDTAGSDIDTVLAVYAGAPGGETVACVDDVPLEPLGRTLQAAATFTADSGQTYWIQIGGFNGDDVLFPTPSVPYGTLKVAVR